MGDWGFKRSKTDLNTKDYGLEPPRAIITVKKTPQVNEYFNLS